MHGSIHHSEHHDSNSNRHYNQDHYWRCSDGILIPPGRARVLAEEGCSACDRECGEYEASCLGSARLRLSLSTTGEEESAMQHDATRGGEGANGPRLFAVASNKSGKETSR